MAELVTLCTRIIALAVVGFDTLQVAAPSLGVLLMIVFHVDPPFRLIEIDTFPVMFAEVQLIGTVAFTVHTSLDVGSVTVIDAGALGEVVKVKSPLAVDRPRLSAEVTL